MTVLDVSQHGGVRRLRLNRPERLNALNRDLLAALRAQLETAMADDDTAVVVLSGAGRAFCAGVDVKDAAHGDGDTRRRQAPRDMGDARRQAENWLALWTLPKPIIGQVHGYCLGMANELLGCADLVVCGESARFGFPEMRQVALFTTLGFWPDKVGLQRAKELMFTGRLVEGDEAARIGLALECVPDDQLEGRVDELAASIADVGADRLAVVKAAANAWAEARGVRGAVLRGGDFHAIYHQASAPIPPR